VSGLEELSREELIALVLRLRESNVALEERVRQLERRASRNSGNSSISPSSDDLPGRVRPAPERAENSGRKRGKQRGVKCDAVGEHP
jgi:transposase